MTKGYCWVLYGNGIVHISQVIGHSTQTWNRRMVYHWSKSIDPGVLNFESCQSCPYVQVIRTERLSDAVNRWFLTQLVQVFDILCDLLCVCVRWKLQVPSDKTFEDARKLTTSYDLKSISSRNPAKHAGEWKTFLNLEPTHHEVFGCLSMRVPRTSLWIIRLDALGIKQVSFNTNWLPDQSRPGLFLQMGLPKNGVRYGVYCKWPI